MVYEIKTASTMNWKEIQYNSSEILASGLLHLKRAKKQNLGGSYPNSYGNYLISGFNLCYVGEGKNLQKRLIQQSRSGTSTFYKNYKKLKLKNLSTHQNLSIEDFTVQIIETEIGRKEIEEFGIVNLPTNLNRFQKGKRQKFEGSVKKELWSEINGQVEELLKQGEKALKSSKRENWLECSATTCAGLYWIENKMGEVIYIGESSNIFDRWSVHSEKTYFSALRRNIGRTLFGFDLQKINGKKRYFSEPEAKQITKLMRNLKIVVCPVNFGRYELEEYLIRKFKPVLNRKGNMKNII